MIEFEAFRRFRIWLFGAVATALFMVYPAAAFAGIAATATIAPSPATGGLYHYNLVLTNTGTTTIGTFWFAWMPGAGFMTQAPSTIESPTTWTAKTTENNAAIQWVTSAPIAPGTSVSGFSFDSPLTPAQMAAASASGPAVDSAFVYIAAPLADPGAQIVPTTSQLSATATIASASANGSLFHYNLVLTNTGSTTVGTFWFAWMPGAGFLQVPPSGIQSPLTWTAKTTENGGAIQWVTTAPIAPGTSVSGFAFDSELSPAEITAMTSNGQIVDSAFVYIGVPLADPGQEIVPTPSALGAASTITATPGSDGLNHYELVLTNTGTTTVGTFWFSWIPGAGLLPQTNPSNIQSPATWTAKTTENGAAIQWVTTAPIAPGTTISGFSFDSPLTPAQIAGPSADDQVVDTTFVFIAAPLADAGQEIIPVTNSPVVASILPDSRSVQVGSTATVFANMVNDSSVTLSDCEMTLPTNAPAGLAMNFQTTNPSTNAPTGSPNTPASLTPGGTQTFVLSFASSSAVSVQGLEPVFECASTWSVNIIPGVNTADLSFSATPTADVIALAATASNNGIVAVPFSSGSSGAFAVATDNLGAATSITATANTGEANLPITVTLCQTDPTTAACLAPPAASVNVSDPAGATLTFSVFVAASSAVPFDPASTRIFVQLTDASNALRGATSVAVETN